MGRVKCMRMIPAGDHGELDQKPRLHDSSQPISVSGINAVAGNDKPVLWDESLAPYQGIWQDGEALWRDPGIRDYYAPAG